MLSVVAVLALAALPMLLPLLQYWRIMLLGERLLQGGPRIPAINGVMGPLKVG